MREESYLIQGIWSQSKSIASMMAKSRYCSLYISTNYPNLEYFCIFQEGAVELVNFWQVASFSVSTMWQVCVYWRLLGPVEIEEAFRILSFSLW